jgi:uncharacterized protein (TIGR02145 family)
MMKTFWVLLFSLVFINLQGQGKVTDLRDGNVYKTITLQGVTWMAENLRYKSPTGAYSFDNDSSNIPAYGILYDWQTATKVCPDGWHLPTGREFQTLINYNEQKDSWRNKASDPTSFSIQLAGMKDYEGTFYEIGESGYYWTSTEYDKDNSEYFSYIVIIGSPVVDISRKEDINDVHGTEKSNRYSVRCVKN